MEMADVYREYISSLQTQVDALNGRVDSLQSAVISCKDSIAALNTTIAENTNWISVLQSPYGLALGIVLVAVIGFILFKRGMSLNKGDTTIQVGGDKK